MGKKKILVVDDERHIVRLVQVNLERAGYEIITAFDGVEALEQVKTEHPDMMIIDDLMPRMGGFELLKTLQADPRYQNIPIIMLAQAADDASIFKGWASGVSGYYTKPFNPTEILRAVELTFQSLEEPWPDDDQDFDDVHC